MGHANYLIVKNAAEYIFLVDTGNGPSITTTAKSVIEELHKNYDLENRRVIYCDSEDQFDEMLHENGIFKGFKPGHENLNLPPLKNWIITQVELMDYESRKKLWAYICSSLS